MLNTKGKNGFMKDRLSLKKWKSEENRFLFRVPKENNGANAIIWREFSTTDERHQPTESRNPTNPK